MGKKIDIVRTASHLFVTQGFDGTTTAQIAREANATEPLIFYHFKGKDDLFSYILKTGTDKFFAGLEAHKKDTETEFEKIKNYINFNLRYVGKNPDESFLVISACPAKFADPDHICQKIIKRHKQIIESYLRDCVKEGIKKGEFLNVPVKETVRLISLIVVGLMRQRSFQKKSTAGLNKTTIEFCRRSLLKNP